jgi:hypothetical protein
LKAQYDKLLSNFAFKFNLRHYIVANIRLPLVGTDLLVTLNKPRVIAAGSSAAAQTGVGEMGGGEGWAVLRGVLTTLSVHDWGLFG